MYSLSGGKVYKIAKATTCVSFTFVQYTAAGDGNVNESITDLVRGG